jgi:glycosyltransferase involved in cell wall biosynthesis
MRVLQVAASLSPEWGGPVAVVEGLTRALSEQGVQSAVFATTGRRVGNSPILLDHIESAIFQTGPMSRLWTAHAPGLASALSRAVSENDVVHIHELWHYPHYAAYHAARKIGKPYIVTVHGEFDPWAMQQKGRKKWLYMSLIQRRILQQAAAVQAITPDEADQIRVQGIRTPIAVIPNGIDVTAFQNLPPRSAFLQRFPQLEGKRVILFLGRIHPKKGLDILAQAFARLVSQHENVHLVVAGPDEGTYRRQIEGFLATAGVLDKALFTGLLTGTEKLAAFAAADIFVLPSYSEGLSVSMLEALASGIPIVITRQCQFPEVADSGAGVVIEPDAGQLLEAMAMVLDNPEEGRDMGRRGQKLVIQKYTWDSVATQIRKLYIDIVQRNPLGADFWQCPT